MEERNKKRLVDLSLRDFMELTSSESPAPGGGSVSAYMGALGAALGTMVANLSAHKKGWDDRWEEFSEWADKGKELQNRLLGLVDADTDAYNAVIAAMRLPKSTPEETEMRRKAIESATIYAMKVPLEVMETAWKGFEIVEAMIEKGNPNSASDAAVGALALNAAVNGAYLNVMINSGGVTGTEVEEILRRAGSLAEQSGSRTENVLKSFRKKILKTD